MEKIWNDGGRQDSNKSTENMGRKIACLAYHLPLECFQYILCLWEKVRVHVCVACWQEGFQHINITLPHKETQAPDQAPASLTGTGAPPLWRSEARLTQMEFHRKPHFFHKDKWLCWRLRYITWADVPFVPHMPLCTHLKSCSLWAVYDAVSYLFIKNLRAAREIRRNLWTGS